MGCSKQLSMFVHVLLINATGSDIDVRARTPLWQNGWDYNHGTGHGLGYFLNVHEGKCHTNYEK